MKEKKQSLKSKVTYVKKNWMLYIFFLMPALLLTIIFKYVPMGGLLIAFKDYNVIKGVLGSPWVGLEYFKRFLSSPDFMNYLMNTLKVSIYGLLWGFPVPIILALLLNRIRKEGIKKKIQLLIYAPNFISVIVLCGNLQCGGAEQESGAGRILKSIGAGGMAQRAGKDLLVHRADFAPDFQLEFLVFLTCRAGAYSVNSHSCCHSLIN